MAKLTKRTVIAKALAEACPLKDGSTYKLIDVERILEVMPDVLATMLAQEDTDQVEIPGLVIIKKSMGAARKSGFTGEATEPRLEARASLATKFKNAFKMLVVA